MLMIFKSPASDFIGKRRWAYAVSIVVMLVGLVSMYVKGGPQYDIDFTGGTLVQVRLQRPLPIAEIRTRLVPAGLGESIIQIFDDPRDVLIRTQHSADNATELSQRIARALDPAGTPRPRSGASSPSALRSARSFACRPLTRSSPRSAASFSTSGFASTSEGGRHDHQPGA